LAAIGRSPNRLGEGSDAAEPLRQAYDIVLALDPFAGQPLDLDRLKALRSLDRPVILGLPAPRGMKPAAERAAPSIHARDWGRSI